MRKLLNLFAPPFLLQILAFPYFYNETCPVLTSVEHVKSHRSIKWNHLNPTLQKSEKYETFITLP